jgi:chloride channel 3/4/5
VDRQNTVETLRDQLQHILDSGHDDAGFPILSNAKDDGGTRLVGYIGANELEHALSTFFAPEFGRYVQLTLLGIVADEADQEILFHTALYRDLTSSSVSSLVDAQIGADPFDFSVYMDQVCLLP